MNRTSLSHTKNPVSSVGRALACWASGPSSVPAKGENLAACKLISNAFSFRCHFLGMSEILREKSQVIRPTIQSNKLVLAVESSSMI